MFQYQLKYSAKILIIALVISYFIVNPEALFYKKLNT